MGCRRLQGDRRETRLRLNELKAHELLPLIRRHEVTVEEAVTETLDRIAALDGTIQAYITVAREHALQRAKEADARLAKGEPPRPLEGLSIAIKDNICTKGIPTTCASKMLENFIPPYDATVMEKLAAQNVIVLGKLNMDEFAMGSTTETSYFKITRNPRNLNCVPGGSSGGSAAAVAANEAPFALGSDTGGSIRQPASFCGVVGMKPTYGSVSRNGLIAFASSLDQIGTLTRDVRDSAVILGVITGHDYRDTTSIPHPTKDFTIGIEDGISGLRIALPKEYFSEGIAPDVKKAVLDAAKQYEKLGAHVDEVSLPHMKHALPAYYVISGAEASSNLARFDGVKYGYCAQDCEDIEELYKRTRSEGFGTEVKRRIMLGTFVLSAGYYDAYYKKALQVRTLIMNDLNAVFDRFDLILSPVSPTTAYRLGEKTGNPLEMYLGDIFSVPVNIAGVPALALPCGEDQQGLPIGMQLIGRAFSEATLYRAAYSYEQSVKGGAV